VRAAPTPGTIALTTLRNLRTPARGDFKSVGAALTTLRTPFMTVASAQTRVGSALTTVARIQIRPQSALAPGVVGGNGKNPESAAEYSRVAFVIEPLTILHTMATVLVVDDDPAVCKSLMRLIRTMGVGADCALGGLEALAYLGDRAVDLILLDYTMPDLDGLGVLARLRADPRTRDLPVLMCTATPYDAVRHRALALGATGFLAKGDLDVEVLRPWVEPLLDRV